MLVEHAPQPPAAFLLVDRVGHRGDGTAAGLSWAVEKKRVYKVSFLNQGQVYEVFAKRVSQGGLLGFVEIEGLVFGEKTRVVVDPTEERLSREFEGVKRCYLPLHSILRIDEVEKMGAGRITEVSKGATVAPFPMPYFKPGRDSGES
jgi:hypothetical protein